MSLESDIHALIQPIVGGTVIFMDQSAPRPPLPYCAMKIMSVRYVNQDHYSDPTSLGIQTAKGDREFTLNIQRYQAYGANSVTGILQNIVDRLRLSTTIDKFMARKLVAFNTGAVTDISALMDSTQIEKRASLDIFMRYKSSTIDNVGIIETVNVAATYDGNGSAIVVGTGTVNVTQGADYTDGTIIPPINFTYGDVSTRVVYTVTEDVVVSSVELVIDVPFNGEPSTIMIRTGGGVVLMDTTQNSPNIAATFDVSPQVRIAAGTTIEIIKSTGAGCTTGSGFLLLLII